MDSLNFNYDGKSSQEMGLWNVQMGNQMFNEMAVSGRSIIETKVPGRSSPYFGRVDIEPRSFALTFAFREKHSDERIRQVIRWLCQPYYKPLWFENEPHRIYQAIMVSEVNYVHNGLREGYLTVNFRCDSPYAQSEEITVSDLVTDMLIFNQGDIDVYPEIYFTMGSDGDVEIINSTLGEMTKFSGLLNAEEIYYNADKEIVLTNGSIPRYESYNNVRFRLAPGNNMVAMTGNTSVDFKFKYRYY